MPAAPEAAGQWPGITWLLADLSLNVWALALVKAAGPDLPAAQLVFLRASTGLVVLLPWIVRRRDAFAELRRPGLHLMRIVLSSLALAASFHAVARLPLALFTAVNFTRPMVLLAFALVFLAEPVPGRRWLAALAGFCGVILAVGPRAVADPALLALAVAVIAGTGAVVITRLLVAQPAVVLMTSYTVGLTLTAAPLAAAAWVPVAAEGWLSLVAIGVLAQTAQLCFVQAHRRASASVLAITGYAALPLSASIGWLVFAEVPRPAFWLGAAMIVVASWLARPRRDA